MTGIVVKNTGSWYVVKTDDNQLFQCKVKGNFRLKGIRSTNPVAVGDRVRITSSDSGHEQVGLITEILDRRNYIIRKASNLSKQSDIIAARSRNYLCLLHIGISGFNTGVDETHGAL